MEVQKLTPTAMTAAAARFSVALDDPDRAQSELLLRIVGRNAGCEYGRALGFAEITSVAEYRARVPVTDYEALRELNERACSGARDVLFAGTAVYEANTSGTKDGRPKLFAWSPQVALEYHHYLAPALVAMEHDHPGTLDHTLRLSAPGSNRNAAGLLSGFASGFAAHVLSGLPTECPLPDEVLAADFEARYYATLRLGLAYSVRCIASVTPGSLLTLFRRAHEHGERLARDLEQGTCREGPLLSDAGRAAIAPLLRAHPVAARRLRTSLQRHGRFSPIDAWPELQVVQCWKSVVNEHDLTLIREVCPGIPIRPQNSGATEAALLVPLNDAWTGGVPALLSTFFEFFRVEDDPDQATFIPIAELREGQAYRTLVTSERGVYRYALDDVFYVEDVYRGVPVLRYSHRIGLTSSLAGEKLIEVNVIDAAMRAVAKTDIGLGDYQLAPELSAPPHYVLFAEIPSDTAVAQLHEFLRAFEQALCAENVDYGLYRTAGSLGPVILAQLGQSAFERRRRELADATGRSDAQLKLPRLRPEPIGNRNELDVVRWILSGDER